MTTEHEASKDLNISGYHFKWEAAKEYVNTHNPELAGEDYWQAVRLHYLEIGGEYLHQKCAHSKPSLDNSPIQERIEIPHSDMFKPNPRRA